MADATVIKIACGFGAFAAVVLYCGAAYVLVLATGWWEVFPAVLAVALWRVVYDKLVEGRLVADSQEPSDG